MIYALNELFQYRFPLRNNTGLLVSTGSPMLTIKNSQTGEFWNGISWQVSAMYLSLTNLGSGIYGYDMTFEAEGNFTYRTVEDSYGVDESFEIEVSDGVYALVGSTYVLSTLITDLNEPIEGLLPTTSILRVSDGLYFNGEEWTADLTELPMTELSGGSYILDFTYDLEEVFTVTHTEATTEFSTSYKLTFAESLHESQFEEANGLFTLSSEVVIGTDGGNARILDSTDVPIKGAVLEVHNKVTKEVFRAVSNSDGAWSLKVPGGTYIIMISHDDYTSTSIERVVS